MKNFWVVLVLLIPILALAPSLARDNKPEEVHKLCKDAGVPVDTVRFTQGKGYKVILKPGASAEDRTTADAIIAQVTAAADKSPVRLSKPATVTRNHAIDALAVLASSDQDAQARSKAQEIVDAYVDGLR